MIRADEDALICDLAETYGVFDYRSLPARMVATLAGGLRDSSRIKMKMTGEVLNFEQVLLVNIFDAVNWLRWSRTRAAQENGDPPKRLLDGILGTDVETEEIGFRTGEEFERYREQMLRGER